MTSRSRLCAPQAALLAAVLLIGPASCRPQAPEPAFEVLADSPAFITSEKLLLLPARPWTIEKGSEHWELVRPSDLLLIVREPLPGPLDLELRPVDERPHVADEVTFELDGQARDVPWRDGAWQLRATARELPQGVHRLSSIPAGGGRPPRRYAADPAPPKGRPLKFAAFRYRVGDETPREVSPRDAARLFTISDLLASGVTGADWNGTQWGGVLVDGEHRLRVALPRRPARFLVDALNGGPGSVAFSLRAGGREEHFSAAPFAGRTVEIEIAGDEPWLDLDVDSRSDQSGLFLWGGPHLQPAPAAQSPAPATRTLVLVTLDTFRRDLAPLAGPLFAAEPFEPAPMPSLGAFAQQAVAYPRAHAPSPWTLPSHASLFTGLYPLHHEIGVRLEAAPADAVLLGEHLARVGYYNLRIYANAAEGPQKGMLVYSERRNVPADVTGMRAAVVIEAVETHTRTGFVDVDLARVPDAKAQFRGEPAGRASASPSRMPRCSGGATTSTAATRSCSAT
jgi:hypothetical protein